MKKYLLGLLAIAIAFTTVAFTPKEEDMVYFTFTGLTTSSTQVEEESLWEVEPDANCQGSAKACQISVAESDLQDPESVLTLEDTDIEIDAVAGGSSNFVPLKTQGPTIQIHNKN